MLQLQWDPGDCFTPVWRHENLAGTDDVCPKHGIATLQVTWDPGGSTQFWFADKAGNWVQDVLQTPWDPGGAIQYRLGGSRILWRGIVSNLGPAAIQPVSSPAQLEATRTTLETSHMVGLERKASAWPGLSGDLSLSRSVSSSLLLCFFPRSSNSHVISRFVTKSLLIE